MNEKCPKQDPAIRTIAMPADTTGWGYFWWLVDGPNGSGGGKYGCTNCSWKGSNNRRGRHSIFEAGTSRDEVTLYADLESVGRTSMKIHVVAWRRARDSDD